MVPEIWSATDIIFCHLGLFLAFSLPKNLENQNFEKMKKKPRDIIILHKYIKDHDHMLYHSWDMALDRYNFYFSFWAIFYPFIPQQPKRSKLEKKKKRKKQCLEILFYIYVPKIMIRWRTVPEIWCTTDGWTEKVTDRYGHPT